MLSKVREKLEKAYLAPRDFNYVSHIHMLEHEIDHMLWYKENYWRQ